MTDRRLSVLVVPRADSRLRQALSDGEGPEGLEVNGARFSYRMRCEVDVDRAWELLTYADWPVDLLVVDQEAGHGGRDGLWLLREACTMSPDLPVGFLARSEDPTGPYQAGASGASKVLFRADAEGEMGTWSLAELLDELRDLAQQVRAAPPIHDASHRELADTAADRDYDALLQAYPAIVAYYMFENDRIVEHVLHWLDRYDTVRICDIGCGTGRVTEGLLAHLGDRIGRVEVTAVDFSGRMLARLRDKRLDERCPGLHARQSLRYGARSSRTRADPGKSSVQ